MENNIIHNNKVIVKASDILKKLKSPTDRKNFALENSNIYFNYIYINLIFRLVYTKIKRIRRNIFA